VKWGANRWGKISGRRSLLDCSSFARSEVVPDMFLYIQSCGMLSRVIWSVKSCRRLDWSCCLHLRLKQSNNCDLNCFTLKMKALGSFKTSANIWQSMTRYIAGLLKRLVYICFLCWTLFDTRGKWIERDAISFVAFFFFNFYSFLSSLLYLYLFPSLLPKQWTESPIYPSAGITCKR
jgi:hypothetical protein